MAVKYISDLTAVNTLSETDVFVVDDGSNNYKISWNALKALLGTVSTFTNDDTTGTITVGLANGTSLSITPHDPAKQNKLTFDNTPASGSMNPVTSSGIKAAIDSAVGPKANPPRGWDVSIGTSDWSGSGPYTYTINDNSVTVNTHIVCDWQDNTQENAPARVNWSTRSGAIVLSTATMPTGTVHVILVGTEVTL